MSDLKTYTITSVDQKLHHVIGESNGRYILGAVHFNERYVVATDGRMLAARLKTSTVQHTNVEFKRAKQTNTRAQKDSVVYSLIGESAMVSSDGKNAASIVEGTFPRWEDCVPSGSTQQTTRIRLDAKALARLAQAICPEDESFVTLEVGGEKDAILVVSSDHSAFGVIMPVSGEDVPQTIVNRVMGCEVIEPIVEIEPSVTDAIPENLDVPNVDTLECETPTADYFARYNASIKAVQPFIRRTIKGAVKSQGVNPRTLDWDAIAPRYRAGEGQKALATEFGVSHGCVFSRMKKMGIVREEKISQNS